MTRDQIIQWAREAEGRGCNAPYSEVLIRFCTRFAQLARADEREQCARICDEQYYELGGTCKSAAADIRSRRD